MATNRLPAASRKSHDNSTINLEIGVRSQSACGSTLTFARKRTRPRQQHYWRKDWFEALHAVASMDCGESWEGFLAYCRAQENGLRKQAFEHLDRFLVSICSTSLDDRLAFVRWVMPIAHRDSGLNLGSLAAEVRESEAVGHDDGDVWAVLALPTLGACRSDRFHLNGLYRSS
ncbi:MAG: hypothetical protein HOI66_05770 [Verrucomicrobia bacterium]|nr:hypothetical protein [Verrucomicrobiota bacterium]